MRNQFHPTEEYREKRYLMQGTVLFVRLLRTGFSARAPAIINDYVYRIL